MGSEMCIRDRLLHVCFQLHPCFQALAVALVRNNIPTRVLSATTPLFWQVQVSYREVPGRYHLFATMQRLTHRRAKAGSTLRTPRSEHRATQPTVPRLSSCACECGKCIPGTLYAESVCTQRVFASAAGGVLLLVPVSQFPLSHPCSLAATAVVTSPGLSLIHI